MILASSSSLNATTCYESQFLDPSQVGKSCQVVF